MSHRRCCTVATIGADKVFFAPADGVCWVIADLDVDQDARDVVVHHLSLGSDEAEPLRTGTFANHGRSCFDDLWQRRPATSLGIIHAATKEPSVVAVPIELADGQSASTPITMTARRWQTDGDRSLPSPRSRRRAINCI